MASRRREHGFTLVCFPAQFSCSLWHDILRLVFSHTGNHERTSPAKAKAAPLPAEREALAHASAPFDERQNSHLIARSRRTCSSYHMLSRDRPDAVKLSISCNVFLFVKSLMRAFVRLSAARLPQFPYFLGPLCQQHAPVSAAYPCHVPLLT